MIFYYNLEVNPTWTYRQTILHLKTLRTQYDRVLASFSSWQYKEKAYFIHKSRDQFYSLSLLPWQKDKLWNYMNHNDTFNSVLYSANRYK